MPMDDTLYDVFIAGILPEKKQQIEQVEAAFLAHYAGRYHLYKKSLQQSGEYCFAKSLSLQQAQEFQKKLLHIGILSRYRPAINHDINFELEPLPEQTITCPFCQHTQKRPENLKGKRCENCKAKMSLFEKRRRMLEKARQARPEPALSAPTPAAEPDALAVNPTIEQAVQKQQQNQRQNYFYSSLILFTLTAILAITGFALYQSGSQSEDEPGAEIAPSVQPKATAAKTDTREQSSILKQGLNPNVLAKISAEQVLKAAEHIKPDSEMPDLNKTTENQPSALQLEAALAQIQPSGPTITPDQLAQQIGALDTHSENFISQTEVQQSINQIEQASPEQRQQLRHQLEQNLPVTPDNKHAGDIFAPLYAMEQFKTANKHQQQRLKKLYRRYLQDKQIAKRLKQLQAQPTQPQYSRGLLRKPHAPTPLDKNLTRWLHPQLADILLNQRFNSIEKPNH